VTESTMTQTADRYYVRFDLAQRIQHIILIITFLTLCITGLPQSFASMGWAQAVLGLLGGIDMARSIHHFAAMILIFMLIYHLVTAVYDLLFSHSRAILPSFQDVKDAKQSVFYLLGKEEEQPRYGRFDFRQKVEYWALIWGTVLMIVTGLILLFPVQVTYVLPGVVIYAAKAAHGFEAALAFLSIVIWHMYNTHFASGLFPLDKTMFSGTVSEERMREEHPLEYESIVNSQKNQKKD